MKHTMHVTYFIPLVSAWKSYSQYLLRHQCPQWLKLHDTYMTSGSWASSTHSRYALVTTPSLPCFSAKFTMVCNPDMIFVCWVYDQKSLHEDHMWAMFAWNAEIALLNFADASFLAIAGAQASTQHLIGSKTTELGKMNIGVVPPPEATTTYWNL